MAFPRLNLFLAPRHVSAVVLAIAIGGCQNNVYDSDVEFATTGSDAVDLMTKPRGTFGIAGTPKAVWLDPRSEKDYAAGHIPGAINVPFPRLESEQEIVLKEVDVIVVYDNNNDDALVMAVAKRLITLGHKEVYVLKGGMKTWTREGNALETGTGANAPVG
ncbi:MAG: rhodanese-like domain-containing protein [Phycisphaerae bacterium]|nr:rhodanese-like domain-containing protein [Phycisphaerae bacterium]